MKRNADLLGDNVLESSRPANKPKGKIPEVKDVIGRALASIGTYNDLDNKFVINYLLLKWY